VKKNIYTVLLFGACFLLLLGFLSIQRLRREDRVMRQIISRLEADSRIAEVLVTNVRFDEQDKRAFTTIKFLEYDAKGEPLPPRYFTFPGNIIQFQSLVIRFNDIFVASGHPLKGKSAYLFWKIFMLDGENTQEYVLTPLNEIPQGYKVPGLADPFEAKLWKKFWAYALEAASAEKEGIKNAQIEAPGTTFVPGMLYTIKIEHDGGLRIDAQQLPPIVQGEYILPGADREANEFQGSRF